MLQSRAVLFILITLMIDAIGIGIVGTNKLRVRDFDVYRLYFTAGTDLLASGGI